MAENNTIQYLSYQSIDKKKWDACIDRADNGLIYAYSFYLDKMAKKWEALVLNDYEAVMPLTWNKKYGIHYLHQPFLSAQLGVFGNIDAEILFSFLKAVPSKFQYWDISLNHKNVFILKEFDLYQRSNYFLDLNKTYNELANNYRQNIKRNVQKANKSGCSVQTGIEAEKVIELAKWQMKSFYNPDDNELNSFKELFQLLHSRGQAVSYAVFSAKNELLASAIFFFSHQRAYYILVGNHPYGKTVGASHALIDAFIKDHAGKKLLLDFEGSDIRNLAFFYSSFGAAEEKYAAIKLNRLPFYLKWLKK